MVLKGPVDADAFVADVETSLVPTLKSSEIVVLGNVSSHHDDRVLPICSYPIENAFEGLTSAFGRLLNAAAAKHCLNFFIACDYG